MRTTFDSTLKAHVTRDPKERVRSILHHAELWEARSSVPRHAAVEYLDHVADTLRLRRDLLGRATDGARYDAPGEVGAGLRLAVEKRSNGATTVGFVQTYLNVPVWGAGITVLVKHGPNRVVRCTDTRREGVEAKLPSPERLALFLRMQSPAKATTAAAEEARVNAAPTLKALFVAPARKTANLKGKGEQAPTDLNRVRFYVYRYDAAARTVAALPGTSGPRRAPPIEAAASEPTLPLEPVPEEIRDGDHRLVAELLVTHSTEPYGRLNWRALVDVETGAVLYLRALIAGTKGLVFVRDPITSSGDTTKTANLSESDLSPFRASVTMEHLDAPSGGTQKLSGSRVKLSDDDAPTVAPPTKPSGQDFDYAVRTDNFAAVSAYHHADSLFSRIEDLGFVLADYFDGTSFPVHIDHRGSYDTVDGVEVNAYCGGDAQGDGIGVVGFCLCEDGNTTDPIGRAVDPWVHWHEIGGHGVLWDHVDSPNFDFAHSAGDGLAAIQQDPDSALRGTTERFRYAPFRYPVLDRRFDRDVTAGWAWGGSKDNGATDYNAEQILATTHFRIYRSLGGDAADLARRQHASRVATWLILQAVGGLTPATNPDDAAAWCAELLGADLVDWTSEGLAGGAYGKVIRWAFEKQGLFQPAAAPTPVAQAGAPPDVDVYIDDGRGGEYGYQAVHWENASVWNRVAPDGLAGHQPAVLGQTNYAYVRVKNRGTTQAAGVTVRGWHCRPGAGLTWPTDFTEMSPSGGSTPTTIAANDSTGVVIGPFEWTPNVNTYGHDCMLMVASATGDASNVEHFGPGETIAEWRLVPHDNNVGQRNVVLVSGAEGAEGLAASLAGAVFTVGNSLRRTARMEIDLRLPPFLARAGWRVELRGVPTGAFTMRPGERRDVQLVLHAGADFGTAEVEAAAQRDLVATLRSDGMVVGGMTWRVDPTLPAPARGASAHPCEKPATELARCLRLGDGRVKKVKVRKVSLDLIMDDDCGCE